MSKINIQDPTAWQELNWDDPVSPDILKRSDATVARSRSALRKRDDPNFSATMSKVATERNEDITYVQNQLNGVRHKRDNTYQAESNARPEVKAKISKSLKGKKKTAEHEAKVTAKNLERANPVRTPYGDFPSVKSAAEWIMTKHGFKNMINRIHRKYLKEKGSGYSLISHKEYEASNNKIL